MTLKSDIDQLAADAVLMHQVVHGDATTTVITAGGPVRSVAKLIADKNAEINVLAGGILAQSVAQVGFATQQAVAAGNSLSQVNIAVAQAISAAGTAQTYSTALAAIASQTAIVPAATVTGFNGVVVTSCIYDTRTDSDGGAWRKRCQNASWYNEVTTAAGKWLGSFATPLLAANSKAGNAVGDYYFNTTDKLFYSLVSITGAPTAATAATGAQVYRGSRKEFPEVVGITAEAGRVIIWDLTDSSIPMWMVFVGGYQTMISAAAGAYPATSIAALNGSIFVSLGGTTGMGFHDVSFIKDKRKNYHNVVTTNTGTWTLPIASRNSAAPTLADNSAQLIVSPVCNSIAVIVLPNAPIDPGTGLPVPTIAVGTDGGVSVIKDDGTPVNGSSISTVTPASYIAIDASNQLYFARSSFGTIFTADLANLTAGFGTIFAATNTFPTLIGGNFGLVGTGKKSIAQAGYLGVTLIKANMAAGITNTWSSGWQVGDSRGAWLADTVAETVSGTPVVASTFAGTGNLDGWTLEATATNNAGVNVLDATSGGATNVLATRVITGLTAGKNYVISFNRPGTYSCSLGILGISAAAFTATAGNASYQFVASGVSHTAVLYSSAAVQRGQFGVISIVECAADRSAKANPLTVFGSPTKAPVAVGSQLVAWSGFAAGTNYLEQGYSANLDFGTGDFCIPVWINPTTAAQTSTIYTRSPAVLAGNSFALNLVGGVLQLGRSIAGAAFANTSFGYTPPVGFWTLVNLVRVAGVIALRINSVQQATTIADTNNYTNATAAFTVGVDYTHANPFSGSLALLRASATPASADQGVYRYETERKLFMPGTQCCIAGSSAVVTQVPEYDDLTGITSIVTSWGVTEFIGLQAINSYATTVGAPSAISTRGGYKLLSGATGSSFYKPSRLLAEELTRTAAQRKAFGARLLKKTFTATSGQTAFDLGIGEEPVSVYQMGVLKDEGAGAGLHTISDSGFRKTIRLGTGATLGDRVTIFYTQNL